jgi:hypothetical protein
MYDNIVVSEFTYADGHKESIARNAANTTNERSNSWFSKLKSGSNNSDVNLNNTQSVSL